jgi:hypothetical protein
METTTTSPPRPSYKKFWLTLFGILGFGLWFATLQEDSRRPDPPKADIVSPQESKDYDWLWTAKQMMERSGAITRGAVGWDGALELTIGSNSNERADAMADQLCHRTFGGQVTPGRHKIRVYLLNGSKAAECVIR